MNIIDLVKQIQNKNFDNFYVFAGEEITLANIYLGRMGNVKRVDTVAEIYSKLTTKNKLFKTNESFVYVVRDDTDFMNNNKVEELISRMKYNTLVFCCTELKKNSKFYKATKDHLIEFNTMTTEQLIPEVKKLLPMDTKMAEQLIIACDNNYGLIVNEIDKVKYSDISIIEELIENSKTYEAYNAVQMLLAKDKDTMKYLINLLEAEQGSELGILGLLFNRASQLLQLQQGVLPPELNDWQAKKLMKINRLNQRDLYRATRWCRIYSEGIKNGEYLAYDAVLLCFMKILK